MEKAIPLFLIKHLQTRLTLAFLGFTAAFSFFYSMMLWIAIETAENKLIHYYLDRYYNTYLQQKNNLPSSIDRYALPTKASVLWAEELRVYSSDSKDLPEEFIKFNDGFYEIPNTENFLKVVTDTTTKEKYYFLLHPYFIEEYEKFEDFVINILAVLGTLIALAGGGLGIVLAKQFSSPLAKLSKHIHEQDSENIELPLPGIDRQDEIGILSKNFTALLERLTEFSEREKSFTRHTSHELRTPIAIIRNASRVIETGHNLSPKQINNLSRIIEANTDMETIVNTFLILGRESNDSSTKKCSVATIISDFLERNSLLINPKQVDFNKENNPDILVETSPPLIKTAIENILRNAVSHSDTHIEIKILEKSLLVLNDLPEIHSKNYGFGYGLEIIKRISTQCHWTYRTKWDNKNFIFELIFK